MAGLRQAIRVPGTAVEQHEDERLVVPADGPDRVAVRVRIALETARASHFCELVAAHDLPALAVPFREAARWRLRGHRFSAVFAVVRVHKAALARVEALSVIAGQERPRDVGRGLAALCHVPVFVQLPDAERADVHLVEPLLHRRQVDCVSGAAKVARVASGAARHGRVGNDAHGTRAVDRVRPDEELPGFPVNHPVGRRAADALGADGLVQRRVDLVELVVGPERLVRGVRDRPQPVGPGHHGARAAFVSAVEHGEVRVDAADLAVGRRLDTGQRTSSRNDGDDERGGPERRGRVQRGFPLSSTT